MRHPEGPLFEALGSGEHSAPDPAGPLYDASGARRPGSRPGTPLTYRAITDPGLWRIGYAFVILGEALTCLAFAAATIELGRNLRGSAARLWHAKRFVYVGAGLGVLV